MKYKLLCITSTVLFLFAGCSESTMDDVNKELNDPLDVSVKNILPSVILQSAFETTGTDIAWYASVYVEHSTGTYNQLYNADRRIGQNAATLLTNNWNSLYEVLNSLKIILDKTSASGPESDFYSARGVAQVLTAYNLAVLTDGWGSVPYSEAFLGLKNMKPKFDKQSFLYVKIQELLDSAIVNLAKNSRAIDAISDYIYKGNVLLWTKAAWSLKARYYMRLTNVDPQAAQKALDCVANGFADNSESLIFNSYEATSVGENPWFQFLNDRFYLSVSKTLYDLMDATADPRIAYYFDVVDTSADYSGKYAYVPAESGNAEQSINGIYSISLITEYGQTAPTPMMTYHELKFIEAEAKRRLGIATFDSSLMQAIAANFSFHGVTESPSDFYNQSVKPLLTGTLEGDLNVIITQKYIAFYEHEAIEAYNDYRRTGIPKLNNRINSMAGYGFVNRFPYGVSETTANIENTPKIDVYKDKVWWAGGTE
ncbi:MAG TPA: SusD/RagB family nutrient-binding outer membrane lipoprotein [Bacteroidales bacterium]|nr:SusD/RagB family nutrient-binding outer membrane lipoprotein [Bacteroidales bacterium]